jgi:hypothetical protein
MTTAVQVQYRRGTSSQVATFTGAQGEMVADTTSNRLVLQDGATAGGWPVAKLVDVGGSLNKFRNGAMDVWQRGAAPIGVTTSGAYTADGWIVLPAGASVTAQQAGGRALTKNSLQVFGAASVTDLIVKQRIESNIAAALAGQTVTVQAQIGNLNYPASTSIGTGSSSSGATCTIASVTVPAGALIVVLVTENAGTIGTTADGTNGAYTAASSGNFNGAADVGGVFYFQNSAALSGATITYTKHTSGNSVAMSAFYVTGIATASALDVSVTATATGSSTMPSVASGTPGALNELIVGAMFCVGAPSYGQSPCFATPPNSIAISTTLTAAGGVMVGTLGQPVTFAPTLGTSEAWLAITVGFKAALPGSAITPKLTVRHPSIADNWASALTTDVNAVSLQSCPAGAWTQVAYTFSASMLSGNGLEISFDLGSNFGTATSSIQLTELDIRATPGVATGQTVAPPPPELRSIAAEIALCQRYFAASFGNGVAPADGAANAVVTAAFFISSAQMVNTVAFPAPFRAIPTIGLFASNHVGSPTAGQWQIYISMAWNNLTGTVVVSGDTSVSGFVLAASYSGTTGQGVFMAGHWTASAEL